MVYFGSFIFKITRLLVIAVSSVHFFACLFYKVIAFDSVSVVFIRPRSSQCTIVLLYYASVLCSARRIDCGGNQLHRREFQAP